MALVRPLLSPTELEILNYLAHGYTDEAVAGLRRCSPNTVRTHRQNILSKLGVHTSAHAVGKAYRDGILATWGRPPRL